MKVLLTGGSGFLGKHCLDILLQRGHTVVTTVRSDAKGKACLDDYPSFSGKLSYTVVEDMARSGAFDEAVKSEPPFEAVVHTASPFHYHAKDPKRDMIDPAIMGTTEILRAVKKGAPSVKRVVITSSFASVINMGENIPVYTADIWNPITMEQALTGGPATYVGSKKFAEKAAWDFISQENPGFTLAVVNPVMIFGPVTNHLKSLDSINTSNQSFADIIQGKMKSKVSEGGFQWVDVRDVALAHVRAIEVAEAAGKRFLAASGPFSNAQIAKIVKENVPELKGQLPDTIEVPKEKPGYVIDTTPAREILGISFRSLQESVIDTVQSLMKVGS
ncbi:dihydroflavonol-4-reductase [Corynespora cassiicola Philippines]|uniref:Dihydroflavonol-4-reductase n=1 Tax=Corynespora cassiicola Philippines TaxID=1448308 RepID=A0A2T2NIC6_CORCC|nr:dihydroflavonol-4-reductase [Corynespora cassiicola Philippines]